MPLRPVRALLIAGAITLTAALAGAQDNGLEPRSNVRGATADGRLLLNELIERSATARDLVDRLEQSDVIVYIRYEWFPMQSLRGRIGFLASGNHPRLLAIEIDYRHTRTDQLSALGHELQHAVEIASAPWVINVRALAEFYTSIGELSGYARGFETYETTAAAETGRRVRSELNNVALPADAAGPRH